MRRPLLGPEGQTLRESLQSSLTRLSSATGDELTQALTLLDGLGRRPQEFGTAVLSVHMDRIERRARLLKDRLGAVPVDFEEVTVMRDDLVTEVSALNAFLFKFDSGTVSMRWTPWPALSWPNLLYTVQTYALMMAMVMCVAIFVGSMMGIFLFVMSNVDDRSPNTRGGKKRWFATSLIFALPFLLFAGSLCISNSARLLMGQSHGVSFVRCRALILCTLLKAKAHRLSQTAPVQAHRVTWGALSNEERLRYFSVACRHTDMWFRHVFACLLGIPASAITVATLGSETDNSSEVYALIVKLGTYAWGSAMFGAFVWAFLTICLYIGCDLYAGNNAELRRAMEAAETAMLKYDVRPGSMQGCARLMLEWMALDTALNLGQEGTRWLDCRAIRLRDCLLPLLLLLLLVALVVLTLTNELHLFGEQTNRVKLLMVIAWVTLSMCVLAFLFRWAFRELLSPPFLICVVALAVFIDAILVGGLELQPLFHGKPVPVPLASPGDPDAWVYENLDFGERAPRRGEHPPYPACLMRWGAREELRLLDLAILSSYAYDPEDASYRAGGAVWGNVSAAFTGGGLEGRVLGAQGYWTVGRVVAFRLAAGAGRGTTVLAVKGSSEAFDFYADAGLWAMICAFQAFMVFVPLLDQLPNELFAGLLYWLPRTEIEKQIFAGIREVHSELARDPRYRDDAFVITGHSLGGGIATAAGGSLGLPAVSFSGPGSHFSRWRFGTTMEGAYRSALTVKPEVDIVHKIDRHDEVGQYIECRDPHGVHRDAGTCHMIGTTICELWRACGDHRGRDFRAMCRGLLGDPPRRGLYLGRPA